MKNFSGVCQAAGADKPLRAFFIWITNIVTLPSQSLQPLLHFGFAGTDLVGGKKNHRLPDHLVPATRNRVVLPFVRGRSLINLQVLRAQKVFAPQFLDSPATDVLRRVLRVEPGVIFEKVAPVLVSMYSLFELE